MLRPFLFVEVRFAVLGLTKFVETALFTFLRFTPVVYPSHISTTSNDKLLAGLCCATIGIMTTRKLTSLTLSNESAKKLCQDVLKRGNSKLASKEVLPRKWQPRCRRNHGPLIHGPVLSAAKDLLFLSLACRVCQRSFKLG